MKIHTEFKQGSPEWFEIHRGVPTASKFDQIMTPVARIPSKSQSKLIYELVGELSYPGKIEELWGFTSQHMTNGAALEAEARRSYSLIHNCEIQQVGFVFDDAGQFGCSPDGLIGSDGGLEIKCPKHATHAEYLHKKVLPSDYACQVHGSLIVTGLKYWDFMSYARGLPPFVVRVEPNGFTEDLRKHLGEFWTLYMQILADIGGKRPEPKPAATIPPDDDHEFPF